MGAGKSKQVCSLRDRYHTWSLKYVPDDIIVELAKIIEVNARADIKIITDLRDLLGFSHRQVHGRVNDPFEVAKDLLQMMRDKDVCRKTWCDHHRDHLWRENEPRCYTIGGMQIFFRKYRLENAVLLFDTNRERIEKFYYSKQYPNFIVHGWCAFCNFIQRCHQRNSLKNLHVMTDLNSLGPSNTCIVVMLLKQTEFVTTPFVIPRRPKGQYLQINEREWRTWRSFVKRQIESLGPGAVLIMKFSKMLLEVAEQTTAEANDNLDTMEVRCKAEALKFIWLCAMRYRITLIGVRPVRCDDMFYEPEDVERDENEEEEDEDDQEEEEEEEENEEAAEAMEERIAKVFSLGCYRLPGEESNFAECLLMCAYLAKKQPSSWSRPPRRNA